MPTISEYMGSTVAQASSFSLIASSTNLGWSKAAVYQVQGSDAEWTQDFYDLPALALHTSGREVKVGTDGHWIDEYSYPGLLSFFPASTSMNFRSTGDFRSIVTYLDPDCFVPAFADASSRNKLQLLCNFKDDFADAAVRGLLHEAENPSQTGSLYADAVACALSLHLARKLSLPTTCATKLAMSSRALRIARELIEASIESGISLQELAATVGLSRAHFAKAFKATTGMGPHSYLTVRRVAKASKLLSNTAEPIAQIALRCGFSSQAHFSDCFKRATGCTPSQYRRSAHL